MRLREAMATDESFIDPFWICTNLGFVQTDATLEKSYGYLSALKSGETLNSTADQQRFFLG